MNWKQLYARSSPEERLDLALHMLNRIETRREAVIITIDIRRKFLRAMFVGILGILTFTTAIITAKAEPELIVPSITAYIMGFFMILVWKPKKQEAHFLRAAR
jgi:hypothetical protein